MVVIFFATSFFLKEMGFFGMTLHCKIAQLGNLGPRKTRGSG
jgi:hypothetical protein